MPTVWPSYILIFAATLTLVPAAVALLYRSRERGQLRALAASRDCKYRPGIDGELARRLGPHLPTIGAAAVRVFDDFEVASPAGRRLILRVDYTLGSVRSRRNCTRIVSFEVEDGSIGRVGVAPLDLDRIAQFERLLIPPSETS